MTTLSQRVYEDPEPKKGSVKYYLQGTSGAYRPAHYEPRTSFPSGQYPKRIRVTVEAIDADD